MKKNRKFNNKYLKNLFLILMNIIFFTSLIKSENKSKLMTVYQISLIVKGPGIQMFLGSEINKPDELKINGKTEEKKNIHTYDFQENENSVEIIWYSLPPCKKMFKDGINIISVDLSLFDSSQITNVAEMFYSCEKLQSINFGDFDTSKVQIMDKMFYYCKSLKSLDLSRFNTSIVKSMDSLFYGAESLISLNLANFNTSLVKNMDKIFFNCKSLLFLNINSFIENKELVINDIVSNDHQYLIYCINSENSPKIVKFFQGKNFINDCENNCFKRETKIIIEKKICVENCSDDDRYIYEQNNICTENEPNNILSSFNENSENFKSSENSESLQNFESLESSEILENNQNSIISQYPIYPQNSENSQNIQTPLISQVTENPQYIGKSQSFQSSLISQITEHPQNSTQNSENLQISQNAQSSENYENQGNNENNYNTEILEISTIPKNEDNEKKSDISNEKLQFNSENFFKESKQTNNEEISNKDDIIKNIQEDIINGNLSSLLSNLINGEKKDLIAQYKDITYQITTTENQKDGSYNNISTIDLGDCEKKLKGIYDIAQNISLIILKIDYKMDGLLIPVIGYEVYHPINKSQLNLSYCKDINIKINIPVSIDEDNIEKYNPNSDFYNDECYAYTTENGTDIILNDRKNEYSDNNMSLCENNCLYNGYNINTKKASCECIIKVKISKISDIITDENILSNNLNISENSKTNIATMKCVSLLFSKNGLIKNIGSYILFLVIILFTISIFIFYKCGYQLIENSINEILDLKINNQNNIDIFNPKSKHHMKKKKKKKKMRKKKRKKKKEIKEDLQNPPPKRKLKKKAKKLNSVAADQQLISGTKFDFKNTNSVIIPKIKNRSQTITNFYSSKKIIKVNSIKFKESELNSISYKEALIYDKRTFGEYYLTLNKIKISILFAFYPINDYNIKIIKICLFFLSFVIHFSVNTFFFNDNTFHQIYLDGGKYNFLYFLPQIIYSFIISYLINDICKFFCLSERNLLEIKNEENPEEINNKAESIKRCLIIKYIIFFVSSFIFLIVFWYYLSSFCAVYQNTQIYLAINALISYIISSVYPLIFNLLPCILRVKSLKNIDRECLYKISKFIQII